MASTNFQSTHFNPTANTTHSRVNPAQLEEQLAREMARQKQAEEARKREIERICAQSDELKELQMRVKGAYLNKERVAQITEQQYRRQNELVSGSLTSSFSVGARCLNGQYNAAQKGNSR